MFAPLCVINMKKFALLVASLIFAGIAQAENKQLVGTWVIEPENESKEQFPWWYEIKYPKKLIVTFSNGKYLYTFIDQFNYECEGNPMLANQGKELVFEFCGGLGTKSPLSWSPIHHAKVVDGKLYGVVTNNKYLFKWVGVRQP